MTILKQSLGKYNYHWVIAGAACILFLWLSQRVYFADSEIFSLTISRVTSGIDIGQAYKFLFSLLLKLLAQLNGEGVGALLLARLSFGLLGVMNLFLAAGVYKTIFRRPHLEATVVLFILGFTFFVERGFRVRADNLAATWHLLTLWYYYKFWLYRSDQKGPSDLQIVGLGFLELIILATTIKGLIIILGLHIFYLFSLQSFEKKNRRQLYQALARKLRAQLDLFLIVILGMQFFTFQYHLDWRVEFFDVFFGAFDYFSESIHPGLGVPDYLSKESFFHVMNFLKDNMIWSALIYFPLVFAVSRLIKRIIKRQKGMSRVQAFYLYCFFLIVLFLLFPEKYPFLLVGLLPVLSLPGVRFLHQIMYLLSPQMKTILTKATGVYLKFSNRDRYSVSCWMSVGLCTCVILSSMFFVLRRSGNREQIFFIKNMTHYLNQLANVSYYDVIGSVPGYPTTLAFAGPSQGRQNREAFYRVEEAEPSLIFYTQKMTFLEPQIGQLLSRKYLSLGSGVYVRGQQVAASQMSSMTKLWQEKNFRVLSISELDKYIRLIEGSSDSKRTMIDREPSGVSLQTSEMSERLVPFVYQSPIYFYESQEDGNYAPFSEIFIEDREGFISAYDANMSWENIREKYVYIFVSASPMSRIGLSIFPPLNFSLSEHLSRTFSYDRNF